MTPAVIAPAPAIEEFLARLDRPVRLMVAVSGGSDSLGLLHLLHERLAGQPESGVSLCAATIDHALRQGSAEEAETVARLCAKLGIPHTIRRREGEKPVTRISATAREARYRLLVDAAVELGADAFLLGHTLDDQEETLAMRASRSRADYAPGMAGIPPATLIEGRSWALRPLLRSRRTDIRDYLCSIGEGWIDDPSNIDPRYERVRIRRQLAAAGPSAAVVQRAESRDIVSRTAAELVRRHAELCAGSVLRLAPAALDAPQPELRYALGGLLAIMGGSIHRPSADTMDRLMTGIAAGGVFRATAARCVIELRRDGLYICREDRNLPGIDLPPGATAVWDGRFRIVNGTAAMVRIAGGDEAMSDGAGTDLPPRLAALGRRSGPRVRPAETDAPSTEPQSLAVTPFFPHFEHFLPVYDLALANAIAALFGRKAFPAPPGTHY